MFIDITIRGAHIIKYLYEGVEKKLLFGTFATTQGKQANTVFKAEKRKLYIFVIYLT